MIYPVVRELAADGVPVATACRVLQVSASGYYDWLDREPSARERADAELTETITAVHAASYGTTAPAGSTPNFRLGRDIRVGRTRVERWMRCSRLRGVHRRRLRGCTRRDEAAEPAEDLVQRFAAAEPDRLYVADITQHRTGQGWYYLAVVLDVFSRRVVGWAMADHLRAELVVDALQMALWQRRPASGAIHHSDHGSIHQLGVRPPPARGRPARLDGQHRRLLREWPGRELLRHLADRAARPAYLDHPRAAGRRCLRLPRGFYNPPPPALRTGLPQPRRLRDRLASTSAHARSMITLPRYRHRPGNRGHSRHIDAPPLGLGELPAE